ncbi:MAG: hypothetical protein O3C40_21165 [Planctomycetota bacterium]|nr:hypothetical protein [Planctomycetota bacterium]
MKPLLAFLACLSAPTLLIASEPIDIGSRRELFVDDLLIDKLSGEAELRLHHPTPREVAIVHDAPWEGSGSGYHTVFQDGDLYRLYHRGSHLEVTPGKLGSGDHPPFYCYAESKDGIQWTKPELGIVEFHDSKKNNIILEGLGTHNFAPFKDTNPDCSPEARYKALGGIMSEGGLFAFQSADAIHWSLIRDKPVITKGAFDSQNLAFWDATIGKYRCYFRIFTGGVTTKAEWKPTGVRAIRTGTSSDFLNWGDEADLTYVDSPQEQLYTNQIAPYYRAPHILIGMPSRYIERGWSESMRALPDREKRELRASAHERYGTALTEGLLMASRDGVLFKRWNEAFLRPGIGRPGSWQYGQQYIAWNVVETASSLPGAPHELSLYATEDYWHGKGGTLRRYTLRMDGFVSINAPMKGGEFLSRPLNFTGSKLTMNFATSAAGSVRVEIQDASGEPIEGFSLADCPEQFGDSLNHVVTWKDGADVTSLSGNPVRLRFVLNDADLYSLQFAE